MDNLHPAVKIVYMPAKHYGIYSSKGFEKDKKLDRIVKLAKEK